MINIYERYLGWSYFKNLFIIFIGLVFFYVGVDYLINLKDLPESANLQFLYLSLNTLWAVNYALPLAIVFAMIVSKFNMIRSNELISLYASGISKKKILRPIFIISLISTFIYIGLNFTPFAYAHEYRSNLLKNSQLSLISEGLFLKYKKSYVYIQRLDPIKQEARDIKIFNIDGTQIKEIIEAKSAIFKKDAWDLRDGKIIHKPEVATLFDKGLKIEPFSSKRALEGFKPKIIENAHQGGIALTVKDAVEALRFFSKDNINTDGIKSNLYYLTIFPLFAPFMLVILYYYLPASARFFNLALLSFIFIFATLCVWGILFILFRLSQTSVVLPEIGMVAPIIILALFGLWLHTRSDKFFR
ncbi:MAG: YjgP/YjgQ family permease [Campylobacteraceae bacterium]|nr:YjgP/YjgQ family permease [Campylobacteraceae bacterium]